MQHISEQTGATRASISTRGFCRLQTAELCSVVHAPCFVNAEVAIQRFECAPAVA